MSSQAARFIRRNGVLKIAQGTFFLWLPFSDHQAYESVPLTSRLPPLFSSCQQGPGRKVAQAPLSGQKEPFNDLLDDTHGPFFSIVDPRRSPSFLGESVASGGLDLISDAASSS